MTPAILNSSKNFLKYLLNIITIVAAIVLIFISLLYFVGAWNLQWSAGHLLIPVTDDWGHIDAFANYLTGQPYFNLIFIRYMGHPEFFIKLIAFIYFKLGFYSYKEIIAYHVVLQLIPVLTFILMLSRYSKIPLALKLLLIPIPFFCMFNEIWWGFFYGVLGFLWGYGYVLGYLSLFLISLFEPQKRKWPVLAATIAAFIACQFFITAFAIWAALFFFNYSKQWPRKNYYIFLTGMICSFGFYLLLIPGSHDMVSRCINFINHPLETIGYTIILFGDDGKIFDPAHLDMLSTLVGQSLCVFVVSLYIIVRALIKRSQDNFECFINALFIFSFLIICLMGYGRMQDSFSTSPFHYAPCVWAFYIPFSAILAITAFQTFGRALYPAIICMLTIYILHPGLALRLIHNENTLFMPSQSPGYARMSLILASLEDSPIFETKHPVQNNLTYINTLAKHKYAFAAWPALKYKGQIIGKGIQIESSFCNGEIAKRTDYDFSKWKVLELTGWSWNNIDNSIPNLILFTDENNKILSVAAGEMTQFIKQSVTRSSWVTYIPYEKLNTAHNIKVWVLTDAKKACFVKTYSRADLHSQKPTVTLFEVRDLTSRGYLP